MFIAGIIAAGVAGTIGVIAHSDHSDYSDYYSDYSDYAEKERKRKKAELNAKENELKQQLENECNQAYETIKLELQENNCTSDIDLRTCDLSSKSSQNKLKLDIEKKLMASLDEDKAALKDINDTLKRINEIQLKVKNDIKAKE